MPRYKFYYNVPGTGCVAMQARDAEEAHEKSADNEWDDFMGEDLEYTVTEIQIWEDRELD